MAESDIRQFLDEVVKFIRELPVDFENCRNLSECRQAAARSVRAAAPDLVQRLPLLLSVLAATYIEQVINFLVELAVRSKCPIAYLTPEETCRLNEAGFSSREQILIGRLRDRLTDNDTLS